MTLNPAKDPSCVLAFDWGEGSGNTVYDLSGHGNNGTIYGATRTRGILRYAVSLDGIDDSVVYSGQVYDAYTVKKFTIAMWINVYIDNTLTPPSTIRWYGTFHAVFNNSKPALWFDIPVGTTSPPVKNLHIYIGGRNKSTCSVNNIPLIFYNVFNDITKGWTGWIFTAFSVDATDETAVKRIGILNDTVISDTIDLSDRYFFANYPDTNPCSLTTTPHFQIPKTANSAYPYWKLTVGSVRIYNRALSEKEIREHYYYGKKIFAQPEMFYHRKISPVLSTKATELSRKVA